MTRLNIAQLEAERAKKGIKPFEVEFPDGAVFTFKDPRSLDWKVIMSASATPSMVTLGIIMDEKEFEQFKERDGITGYILEEIMNGYLAHYGISSSGEARGSRK
jgi:hypothetical protein